MKKINISFLICCRSNENEPVIAVCKKGDSYEIPTFELDVVDSNIDVFVSKKFEELTGFTAKFKSFGGWVNVFICGTIVDENSSSIVFACTAPELFAKESIEWKTISSILESGLFENSYSEQVVSCFNYFWR